MGWPSSTVPTQEAMVVPPASSEQVKSAGTTWPWRYTPPSAGLTRVTVGPVGRTPATAGVAAATVAAMARTAPTTSQRVRHGCPTAADPIRSPYDDRCGVHDRTTGMRLTGRRVRGGQEWGARGTPAARTPTSRGLAAMGGRQGPR